MSKQEAAIRSEEHTSELQSRQYLVCRLLLEKKKKISKKFLKKKKKKAPHCTPKPLLNQIFNNIFVQ